MSHNQNKISLKSLQSIPTKIKYSVHGWIRESERQLKLYNVPLLIITTALIYFSIDELISEFFAAIYDVDEFKTKLSCISEEALEIVHCVLLSKILVPRQVAHILWEYKVECESELSSIALVKCDDDHPLSITQNYRNGRNYVQVNSSGALFNCFGKKPELVYLQDDAVKTFTLQFNGSTGDVTCNLNGSATKHTLVNLLNDTNKYRLVLELGDKGDSVTLTSFTMKMQCSK